MNHARGCCEPMACTPRMIERIDDPKGHYYRDPDSGMLLPGVTMILDAVAPEPEALTRYGRRLDAEAGIRTGTTIHGDYEEVPAELAAEALGLADARRYQAMAAGTAAHADIAAWLNSNDQRTPLGGPHPDDAPARRRLARCRDASVRAPGAGQLAG